MRTEPLSEIELAELKIFREKIINRALSTEPIDRERAEQAYNNLLNNMGHTSVSNFHWFESPLDMHKNLRDQLWDQLWDQLGDQLWDQLRDQLGDQLRDQLGDQLRDQLGGQLGDQLRGQLRGQLRAQLRDQLDQWQLQYYMWMDYASELDQIEVDKDKLQTLKQLSVLGENAFWIIPLKDGAAFCERPTRLVMERGLLHYDQGAAIEFKDGWKHFYLRGVNFDEETYSRIVNEEITLENLKDIENADQRAVAVQMLRPDRLLKQVNAKLIDTGKKGTRLYEVPNFMDTGDTEFCMLMDHPSVEGKQYIEWVHPETGKKKDADLAQAVAFGVSKKSYLDAEEA